MRSLLIAGIFTISHAASTLACSVCFGSGDSNLVRGFTWGIAILLVLPFFLAAGVGGLIAYSIRKNKRHV